MASEQHRSALAAPASPAEAYGASPRLRADVVVNNLVGVACTTGEVLMQSDGTPWRPLVHVEDISRASLAALEAPREVTHNEAFNVGSTSREPVPTHACYRVNCDKLPAHIPGFRSEWTGRRGIEELDERFVGEGLTEEMFAKYVRLARVQELIRDGDVDTTLRRRTPRLAFQTM
jgi:nucleoside-diphosphate-sugar epimerase